MDKLYVVMPAYNEEENIEEVAASWYPVLNLGSADSRLVIADSGSTDRTHQILVNMKQEFPKLEILSNTEKQHGPKLIALYNYAVEQKADFIFQTDSDGQTDPGDFRAFWKNRNRYDAIIGYRKVRGDGKAREMIEKVVCLLLRLYFGVKILDANAPFRLMRSSLVKKYMGRFPENYNLPNIMLTTWFVYYKENIRFRTVFFGPRKAGENSVNIPKIVRIGWKALADFHIFKKEL